MLRAMILIYWILAFGGLTAQNQSHEISYSGVYRGEPLFIQNPYSVSQKSYCIKQIVVNDKSVKLNYNRSALMVNFDNVPKFSPVAIHITYGDSLCIPSLVNPDAIRYHSLFTFENVLISDSSIVWMAKGEHSEGEYRIEEFYLGTWEPLESYQPKGVFGAASYSFNPVYEEGVNKFRIVYLENGEEILSQEVEHVYYPEPVSVQKKGNQLILSRSCSYVISDQSGMEVLNGTGKEIDISSLGNGNFYILLNEDQVELFRKNDQVKVLKKPEPRNN